MPSCCQQDDNVAVVKGSLAWCRFGRGQEGGSVSGMWGGEKRSLVVLNVVCDNAVMFILVAEQV